jgi:hypothetical protein
MDPITIKSIVEARRVRRRRIAEFQTFCTGAALVFSGLLLASLYLLLTHQVPA